MAIRIPGPRLLSAVPFKHLARIDNGGTKQNANIDLNLTPFVDMMTILVTFLLMVFSASGEILTHQAGLELPMADQQKEIQRAPVIIITEQSITFNGEHMAEVDALTAEDSTQWKIVELFERLKVEKKLFELGFDDLPESQRKRCTEPRADDTQQCERGLAILQADKDTKAKVLNRVLKTANAAGYVNIMFAVDRQSGGPAGG